MTTTTELTAAQIAARQAHVKCTRAFDAMKLAESAMYAANRKADEARKEWEEVCREKALANAPEIPPLLAKIERLEQELATAKFSLKVAVSRTQTFSIFSRWLN